MQPIRLNRNDLIFIVICLVVLAAGTLYSVNNFQKAFPEASIDFQVSKDEAGEIGIRFLEEQVGFDVPEEYREATRFFGGGLDKIYLERELRLEEAQNWFNAPVPVWGWYHRAFMPGVKREYRVEVSPGGEVFSFRRLIEETAEGDSLEEDSARAIAYEFMTDVMEISPDSVELHETKRQSRPNRVDWIFTWKRNGPVPVGDEDYRYDVTLQGSQIGMFQAYMHIPQVWRDGFRKLRGKNQSAGMVASALYGLTMLGLLFWLVRAIIRRDIQWRTALVFGIIAAVLTYLNQLNELPLRLVGYNTEDPWGGFLADQLLFGLLQAMA
ncbi:hypothetical protein GF324_07890, partial [bacterium]|nr:hypothetical protein [bacterium]